MKTAWEEVVELVASIYILLSPFVLGFFHVVAASITFLSIGTAVLLTSQLGIARQQPWEEWVNLSLGVLLMASPWLFGYYAVTVALFSAVVAGAVLALMAIIAMIEEYAAIRREVQRTHQGGLV